MVVAHACNPSTWGWGQVDLSVSSRPAWSTVSSRTARSAYTEKCCLKTNKQTNKQTKPKTQKQNKQTKKPIMTRVLQKLTQHETLKQYSL
jgi:membrane-anchored protein YejM (alkaline phosphatase superfamily)